jgi:hypothetical protein
VGSQRKISAISDQISDIRDQISVIRKRDVKITRKRDANTEVTERRAQSPQRRRNPRPR